jgi:hypothetical protein
LFAYSSNLLIVVLRTDQFVFARICSYRKTLASEFGDSNASPAVKIRIADTMINRQWLPALLNYRTEPPLAWEAQHKLFGFPIPA